MRIFNENTLLKQETDNTSTMKSGVLSFQLVEKFYTRNITQQAVLACNTGLTQKKKSETEWLLIDVHLPQKRLYTFRGYIPLQNYVLQTVWEKKQAPPPPPTPA